MTSIQGKKLIIFDLDGTLTPPKQDMEPVTAELLTNLIKNIQVAVISGGNYLRFQNQFLKSLPQGVDGLSNLYLLPTSGTRLLVWQNDWVEKYKEELSEQERKEVKDALTLSIDQSGLEKPTETFGQIIEDRGSQITFSALGQEAPLELKVKWDPTHEKRQKIIDILRPKLPKFDIRIGGTTSIDITRRGMNKAYGIHKLEQYLKISLSDMLFVGDALFYGGNDYPVKATGIDCIEVKGPEETDQLIKSWFA
ncbi:MAG: HAD-IIB family hydrolase [Candidatus Taylorbacteria bacterium]|nr:HAD-IIB family hydrolase [Candidatus Taylorbacteria bacterium]